MFYEISRKSINVNNIDKINMIWNDSFVTICINKNIHMLEMSHNLNSLERKIDFNNSVINCSTNSPVPENFLSRYVCNGVRNSELVEMMTNPALWPHNEKITKEMTDIVQFDWLPHKLLWQNQRLLSVLNSVGNIELYIKRRLEWKCVADVSLLMNQYLIDNNKKLPKKFHDIKSFVNSIESSAFCWCPNSNNDNCCYFITAMKNGHLICWLLTLDTEITVQHCGEIMQENYVGVTKITWVPLDDTNILISCNELGQIVGNLCSLENNEVKSFKSTDIWPHKDRMIPTDYLCYSHEECIIVLYNKHRHLIVQMYHKTNMTLISQYVQNVNDFKIISIIKNNNEIYLCTENVKIYIINVSIDDNNMNVSLEEIKIKDSYTGHEVCSFAISKNKAMFALAMVNQKVQHRKLQLKIEIILMCTERELEIFALKIINNPARTLANIWDYIEVLRLKTLKAKKIPKLDYQHLLKEGEHDVYKLKVYYVFVTFYHNLQKYTVMNLKGLMPETSVEKIKDQIFTFQAVKTLRTIYEKQQDKKELSDFDCRCYDGSKKYLEYYCNKYSKCITNLILQNIFDAVHINIQYVCQCCDENVCDFSCKNNHLNMYCSITFTPIEGNNYLLCTVCGLTAQLELPKKETTCVLCDRFLIKSLPV